MDLTLLENWKKTIEVYSLKNDQKMKNISNLISPSGKVVSVFLVEEDSKAGVGVYDKMFRDYKLTTLNLRLLIVGKIKIKDVIIPVYIIREKQSKQLMAHLFFEKEDKLYCLIFNIDKKEKSLKQTIALNDVFKETIKLVEANL